MPRGEARRRKRAEDPCPVNWGTHGCKKQRLHPGDHVCTCKAVPTAEQLRASLHARVRGRTWQQPFHDDELMDLSRVLDLPVEAP
jgi:hypothetical protein